MPDDKPVNPDFADVFSTSVEIDVKAERAKKILDDFSSKVQRLKSMFDPTYELDIDMRKPHRAIDELNLKIKTMLRNAKVSEKDIGKLSSLFTEISSGVMVAGKFTAKSVQGLQKIVTQLQRVKREVGKEESQLVNTAIKRLNDAASEIVGATALSIFEEIKNGLSSLPVSGIDLPQLEEIRTAGREFEAEAHVFFSSLIDDLENARKNMEEYQRKLAEGQKLAEQPRSPMDILIEKQEELTRIQEKHEKIMRDQLEDAKGLYQQQQAWKDFWKDFFPGGTKEDKYMQQGVAMQAMDLALREMKESGASIGFITEKFGRVVGHLAPFLQKMDLLHVGAGGVELGSAVTRMPGIGGQLAGMAMSTGGLYAMLAAAVLGIVKLLLKVADSVAQFNNDILQATAGVSRLTELTTYQGNISDTVRDAFNRLRDDTQTIWNMFGMSQDEIVKAVTAMQAYGDNLTSIVSALPSGKIAMGGQIQFGTERGANPMQEMAMVVKTYSVLFGKTVEETGGMLAEFHDMLLIPFQDLDEVMSSVTDDLYDSAMGADRFFTSLRNIMQAQRLYNSSLEMTSKLLGTLGQSLTASAQDTGALAESFSTAIQRMDRGQRIAFMQMAGLTKENFKEARDRLTTDINNLNSRIAAINEALAQEGLSVADQRALIEQKKSLKGAVIEKTRARNNLNPRNPLEMSEALKYLPEDMQLMASLRVLLGKNAEISSAGKRPNILRMEKMTQVLGFNEAEITAFMKTIAGAQDAITLRLEELSTKKEAGMAFSTSDQKFLESLSKTLGVSETDLAGMMKAAQGMTVEQYAKFATTPIGEEIKKMASARQRAEAIALSQETITIQKAIETAVGGLLQWIGGMVADIRDAIYKFLPGRQASRGEIARVSGNIRSLTPQAQIAINEKIKELEAKKAAGNLSPEEIIGIESQINALKAQKEAIFEKTEEMNELVDKVLSGEVEATNAMAEKLKYFYDNIKALADIDKADTYKNVKENLEAGKGGISALEFGKGDIRKVAQGGLASGVDSFIKDKLSDFLPTRAMGMSPMMLMQDPQLFLASWATFIQDAKRASKVQKNSLAAKSAVSEYEEFVGDIPEPSGFYKAGKGERPLIINLNIEKPLLSQKELEVASINAMRGIVQVVKDSEAV